jgi:glutamine amidotransferase
MQSIKKVVIIDYKLGNLFSVKQACGAVGISAEISSDRDAVIAADALILPGVGAFSEAMENLRKSDLVDAIVEKVKENTPLFGICLGQQLLFSGSEEFGPCKGLSLIEGAIKRFSNLSEQKKVRVPQIAWNKIDSHEKSWTDTPLKDLEDGEFVYFVHSYYAVPQNKSYVLSTTNYGGVTYCSSVRHNNIFATQFHPEKSADKGLTIYRNWALQNNII